MNLDEAPDINHIVKKILRKARKSKNPDEVGVIFCDELCRALLRIDYEGISARLEGLIKEMKP